MSNQTPDDEIERRARRGHERYREFQDIPFQPIDRSKWPKDVRTIGLGEAGGLGVDRDGRLYWHGKPVEIIGQRLDLTKAQFIIALIVAGATVLTALATGVVGLTAYNDWACRAGWPAVGSCPQKPLVPNPGDFSG
jgi:hypothetical protein